MGKGNAVPTVYIFYNNNKKARRNNSHKNLEKILIFRTISFRDPTHAEESVENCYITYNPKESDARDQKRVKDEPETFWLDMKSHSSCNEFREFKVKLTR